MSMYIPADKWLPITRDEVIARGWESVDIVLVSGDAYVDHPSFGHAVIGRLMEKEGFRVAILAQPNWRDDLRDFRKFGRPELFFAVTAGCMDSMVNHYTAGKRRRSDDAYTPGGVSGFRPDNAVITYTKILKEIYPDTPVIIGGIEASLRRLTHYDYWSNSLRKSILVESGADLLVYGMGEKPLREILHLLKKGVPVSSLKNISQTVVYEVPGKIKSEDSDILLSSHEECLQNKKIYSANFKVIERESNRIHAHRILQKTGPGFVVVNPPGKTMTEKEIDDSFAMPYTRMPHPKYRKRGPIPAYEMIKFSLNTHRGCFGGCSFCTISAHQGKFIASRSRESILNEAKVLTQHPEFKGTITDMGGPSANMYKMQGRDLSICERCSAPSCIFPKICKNLNTDHSALTQIYKEVAEVSGVIHAFVSSGIRYDIIVSEGENIKKENYEYATQLINHHVSGRLKVAPEHTSEKVLKVMRKPAFALFTKFKKIFEDINKRAGLKQQIIPYFISSHPGSEIEDMADLATKTKELGFQLEQVQDFTPTPMTVATEIYYSGVHPYTGREIYTAKEPREKKDQRIFFFWYLKENSKKIALLLQKVKRLDLTEKLLGITVKPAHNQIKKKAGNPAYKKF